MIALASILGGDDDGGPGQSIFNRDSGPNGQRNNDSQSDDGDADTMVPPATPLPTPVAVEFVPAPAEFRPPALGVPQSECTAQGDVRATLTWRPASDADEQEVNLLLGGDTFGPGNYLTSGGLDAGSTQLIQTGLRPEGLYFWRINTRIDDSWIAGQPESFETESCSPGDQEQ